MKKNVVNAWNTVVGGTTDPKKIKSTVEAYFAGLQEFLFPPDLSNAKDLADLASLRPVVEKRLTAVEPLTTDIIADINERNEILQSKEYQTLIDRERKQWTQGAVEQVALGARACVDQGIPREAVVGDGHMGRTLAGDDALVYVPSRKRFAFAPSTFVKRLRHGARTGEKVVIELLIEHTGCGRRGQMIANWGVSNRISKLFSIVLANIDGLRSEFAESGDRIEFGFERLRKIAGSEELAMTKDGGIWIGILVKIAQRQAYRNLGEGAVIISPIEVYDKFSGDVWLGCDSLTALTHEKVIAEGGFTAAAVKMLVSQGILVSLKDQLTKLDSALARNSQHLEKLLGVKKGAHTFTDLQKKWLRVKTDFVTVTEVFWKLYAQKDKYPAVSEMVEQMLSAVTHNIEGDIEKVAPGTKGTYEALIERRIIHQLFRAISYAWVLDTFTVGHPPGKHLENHLSTGDSAVLGVKRNLPLGQGDMHPPIASEFFTGRAVLLHSVPGHDGQPIVVFLKLDTDRPDSAPMTTEETQRAIDDFKEFLKLWPYFLVGDMVPVFVIRGKKYGGVSRLGLSVIKAYGDIIDLWSYGLPALVPANNSKGEVVQVSARAILSAALEAGSDLKSFRARVEAIADTVSDTSYQSHFSS